MHQHGGPIQGLEVYRHHVRVFSHDWIVEETEGATACPSTPAQSPVGRALGQPAHRGVIALVRVVLHKTMEGHTPWPAHCQEDKGLSQRKAWSLGGGRQSQSTPSLPSGPPVKAALAVKTTDT